MDLRVRRAGDEAGVVSGYGIAHDAEHEESSPHSASGSRVRAPVPCLEPKAENRSIALLEE